jgi:prepilin-type processing-associated H-X9-DG protein
MKPWPTKKSKSVHRPVRSARTLEEIVAELPPTCWVITFGFLFGLIAGPYLLPDLDVDLFEFPPRARIIAWGLLCSLGSGLAFEVVLTVVEPFRKGDSFRPLIAPDVANWVIALGLSLVAAFILNIVTCASRESGWTNACTDNLKTIYLAMQQYHDEFGCLPPAYVADEEGVPMHTWRVILLPYLAKIDSRHGPELAELYAAYRFDEPWDGPRNRKLANRMPRVYACLKDQSWRRSMTSYVVITGEQSAFRGRRPVKLNEVADDKAKTILAIEVRNSGINWMQPRDYPIDKLGALASQPALIPIGGNHRGKTQIGFVDGSVEGVDDRHLTPDVLHSLSTIDGRDETAFKRWYEH